MDEKKLVILVAGGTAGHINPALCLGQVFRENDWRLSYISGNRPLDFKILKNEKALFFPAKPLVGKNIALILINCFFNFYVLLISLIHFMANRPQVVIGTGGYICGPVLLAAKILGIKTYILEPNSVMGMTNRLLTKIVEKVFVAFPRVTKGLNESKYMITGEPLKEEFFKESFPYEVSDEVRIFVFGGSSGAREINEMIDEVVKIDSPRKIHVFHQMGLLNFKDYDGALGKNIKYERVQYVDDMLERYKWANIIISRAGAGSVFELERVGKPCILIPLSIFKDKHQQYNADYLKDLKKFPVYIGSGKNVANYFPNIISDLLQGHQPLKLVKSAIPPQKLIYKEVIK